MAHRDLTYRAGVAPLAASIKRPPSSPQGGVMKELWMLAEECDEVDDQDGRTCALTNASVSIEECVECMWERLMSRADALRKEA